ncbi:MAG: type II secretion system protein GspH [Gammaproteobacteria bacterium]|nr:MAG: type II secretion system protein GspH [Gammaproteobacteria bacterium]
MREHHRQVAGFTLLELLVVLFLVSLAIGVAATRFSAGTESAELRTEARKLVALLRQTRTRAVSESLSLGVAPVPEKFAYQLQPEGKEVLLPEGLSLNIAADNRDVSSMRPGIFFYPDGSSNGGTLTLSSDNGSRQLAVNWLTGEVAIVDE